MKGFQSQAQASSGLACCPLLLVCLPQSWEECAQTSRRALEGDASWSSTVPANSLYVSTPGKPQMCERSPLSPAGDLLTIP